MQSISGRVDGSLEQGGGSLVGDLLILTWFIIAYDWLGVKRI